MQLEGIPSAPQTSFGRNTTAAAASGWQWSFTDTVYKPRTFVILLSQSACQKTPASGHSLISHPFAAKEALYLISET